MAAGPRSSREAPWSRGRRIRASAGAFILALGAVALLQQARPLIWAPSFSTDSNPQGFHPNGVPLGVSLAFPAWSILSSRARRRLSASIPSNLRRDVFVDEVRSCEAGPTLPGCSPADFTVVAAGGLDSRLHAVCVASAIRTGTNLTARAIWPTNSTTMPKTKFIDLFEPLTFVADSDASEQQWSDLLGPLSRQFVIPKCKGASSPDGPLPASLFLSPNQVNFPGFDENLACPLQNRYRSCLATLLQPSPPIQRLIDSEPELPRLRRSVAAFIDHTDRDAPCRGCEGNDTSMDLCVMRRLTRDYLRDPASDFTVGGQLASEATNVASYYHETRAPVVLQVTRQRALKCPFLLEVSGKQLGGFGEQHTVWRRRLLGEGEADHEASAVEPHSAGSEGEGSRHWAEFRLGRRLLGEEIVNAGEEEVQLQEQLKRAALQIEGAALDEGTERKRGFFEIDEKTRAAAAAAAAAAERKEMKEVRTVPRGDVSPEDVTACVRLQLAELFLLSEAKEALFGSAMSTSAAFVAARGKTSSRGFQVQRSVCEQFQTIRPLTRQRMAMFTVIEEDLKVVMCTIPKVCATSWLMWLRARLGLQDPRNPWLALHEYDSGLHNLAIHFTERQAVRLMTRPDFFKFTFVRDPFSRAASAYANKLVKTDTPGKLTGPGSREYWSWAFFRLVQPMFDRVKDGEGLISFADFARLLEVLFRKHRWQMDRHIAPQVDACFMNSIRYDFIGRFENLQEDVRKVVDRFGGEFLDVFNFGRNAHYTNATGRLARMYDRASFEAIKKVYADDFRIPLNGVVQPVPEVLRQKFGE